MVRRRHKAFEHSSRRGKRRPSILRAVFTQTVDLSSLGQGVSSHAPAAGNSTAICGSTDGAIGWLRATECWTTNPWAVAGAAHLLQVGSALIAWSAPLRKRWCDRCLIVVTADARRLLRGQSLRRSPARPLAGRPLITTKVPQGPRGFRDQQRGIDRRACRRWPRSSRSSCRGRTKGVVVRGATSLPERPRKEIIVTGARSRRSAGRRPFRRSTRPCSGRWRRWAAAAAAISPISRTTTCSAARSAQLPRRRAAGRGSNDRGRRPRPAGSWRRRVCRVILGEPGPLLATPAGVCRTAPSAHGVNVFHPRAWKLLPRVMLPEDALHGQNEVRFFVSGQGDATSLSPLASAPAQGRDGGA